MSIQQVKCFVLHSTPFKETSLLIRLFSQQYGRFSIVAKGIKRKNSQAIRAILQPFNLLNIEYAGRSDLKTLCHAELLTTYENMPSRSLACGYYINELMLRSLQEWQDFSLLFECYQKSVEALRATNDYVPILRNFEADLLMELGVAPTWEFDTQGVEISSQSYYYFVEDKGFQLVDDASPSGDNNANINGNVDDMASCQLQDNKYIGQAVLNFANRTYPKESSKVSQQISQKLLRQLIGDRPLESRKLWL